MAYIYKITNQLNGKMYIGKTTDTIENRWKAHLHDSRKERCKTRHLYAAMNKYGTDKFKIEEVEYITDLSILNEREKYWITYYNTYKNGYNETYGGDGKILIDYQKLVDMFHQGMTQTKIAEITGCDPSTIRKALQQYGITAEEIENRRLNSKQHAVVQLNKDTYEIIATYISCSEAARQVKGDTKFNSGISYACKHNPRHYAYGYLWYYAEDYQI